MLSSHAAVSPRLNASFSFLRIDVMQYTAIYLLLCSMPRYLDTFASNPQGSPSSASLPTVLLALWPGAGEVLPIPGARLIIGSFRAGSR